MIELTYKMNESEWVVARKQYLFRANYIKPGEILMSVLMLIGLLALISLKMVDLWAYLLVGALAVYYGLIAYRYFIEPKKLYGKTFERNNVELVFSKEGVTVNKQVYAWESVKGFDETKNSFFLFKERKNYLTIPKHSMQEERIVALRELLEDELILNRKPEEKTIKWY